MPVKGAWVDLVGRTIDSIVIVERPDTPRIEIHLIFTDDSTFEIFSGAGEYIGGNNRLHRGNLPEVLSWIHPGVTTQVYSAI